MAWTLLGIAFGGVMLVCSAALGLHWMRERQVSRAARQGRPFPLTLFGSEPLTVTDWLLLTLLGYCAIQAGAIWIWIWTTLL